MPRDYTSIYNRKCEPDYVKPSGAGMLAAPGHAVFAGVVGAAALIWV
jgi:hypothetical protein